MVEEDFEISHSETPQIGLILLYGTPKIPEVPPGMVFPQWLRKYKKCAQDNQSKNNSPQARRGDHDVTFSERGVNKL